MFVSANMQSTCGKKRESCPVLTPHYLYYITGRDRAGIQPIEAIKLINVAHTSDTIVLKGLSSVDIMTVLLNKAGVFELRYFMKFLNGMITDIIDDKMSTDYLLTYNCAT